MNSSGGQRTKINFETYGLGQFIGFFNICEYLNARNKKYLTKIGQQIAKTEMA